MIYLSEEELNYAYADAGWDFLNSFRVVMPVEGSEFADLSNMFDGCAFE